MLNPIRDRHRTAVAEALRQALAAITLQAPQANRIAREMLVASILRPALTSQVSIAGGKLVDAVGGVSHAIDVMVYASEIAPQGLVDVSAAAASTVAAEAGLHCVSAHANLTSAAVREACEAARSVRSLHFGPTHDATDERGQTSRCPPPNFALFAAASDLSGDPDDELRRLRKELGRRDAMMIDALCVVGRGYWYRQDDRWRRFAATATHDEVLAYMGGLADAVPKMLAAKGRPEFGHYLVRGYGDECSLD
ncbi:MAG: DUF6602 domain-containing protein [Planctomycetota bacterium]